MSGEGKAGQDPPLGNTEATEGTILVVEDDEGVRTLLGTLLRLNGYAVLSCRDGEEALELMQVRGGDIRLLVTDINLGLDMDGLELAAGLRAIHPLLKVLYISGSDESDQVRQEEAMGTVGFLLKPFTSRRLAEKAKALLSPLPAAILNAP